ncbi:MAG: 30S ribosomal protein S3, partial [Dehalococcoidaceae bacterium]|nr:30S ribosomal protein S3 [Dehalococcoidaceae bacterium]
KVHPIGFRLGIVRDWQSKWYTDKHYVEYLQEDMKLRKAITARYGDAGVSLIEIERPANKIIVTIHTARPGIVIGRGGQRVDETRRNLEELIGKKLQLNVQEIRQPEMDAYLVARSLAEQIERRVAYRRAMKQALFRSMQAGAQGIKINLAGRLGGVEIARSQVMHQGRVPLHTIRADVDYGFTEAHTVMGRIGIKVWLYRGDILPEQEAEAAAVEIAAPAPAVVETVTEAVPAAAKKADVTPAIEAAPEPVKKTTRKAKVEPVAEETPAEGKETVKKAKKPSASKAAAKEAEAEGKSSEKATPVKKAVRTKKSTGEIKTDTVVEPAATADKAPTRKRKAKVVEEEHDASTQES